MTNDRSQFPIFCFWLHIFASLLIVFSMHFHLGFDYWLIALFSFDSSFYLFFFLFLPFPPFPSPWKCVNLFEWSCAVKSYFTISLGVLSSMLCGLWNLDAAGRGWAWTPEVGDSTPGLWTTRELPTP